MNGKTNVTTGPNTDVMEVPLDPVTGFVATTSSGKVFLTWTDPKDKYATPEGEQAGDPDQLVSVWSHTIIVRKEGSDPADENDGVVILSSSVRDQYKATQYTDSNVENQIEYHYGAFAINEDGIASEPQYQTVIPYPYDQVLENNTWVQIADAGTNGLAQSMWEVGDEKTVTIGDNQYIVHIIDFNHDSLSDGSGKAAITFGIKELMAERLKRYWNVRNNYSPMNTIGYSKSGIITTVNGYTFDKMPEDLKNTIVSVNKTTRQEVHGENTGHPDGDIHKIDDDDTSTLSHTTFLFSEIEVCGTSAYSYAGEGSQYSYFTNAANRIKHLASSPQSNVAWMLRSAQGAYNIGSTYSSSQLYYSYITTSGTVTGYATDTSTGNFYFCFGFCVGKSTV